MKSEFFQKDQECIKVKDVKCTERKIFKQKYIYFL